MKKLKLLTPILGIATISGAVIPLVGCSNKSTDQGKIESISVSPASINKKVGDKVTTDDVVVTLTYSDKSSKAGAYGTDFKVFAKNQSGVEEEITLPYTIPTVPVGTVLTSTIKCVKDLTKTATLTINVVSSELSDIELDKNTATVEIGKAFTIKATLKYQTNANEIAWTQSSTDGGELTLSKTTSSDKEEITITGKTKGNVTLKASCGGKEKTCAVEVKEDLGTVEFEYTDVDNVNHTCSAKLKTKPATMSVANIPTKTMIDGTEYTVNAIAEKGFGWNGNVKKVILPSTIIEIKKQSFYSCSDLEEIVLNNGLTTIGNDALSNTKIKSISLPNSITTLGTNVFSSCSSLEDVVLNDGLAVISAGAFSYTKIKSITLPSSITTIGKNAFSSCKELTTINLNNGLQVLDESAFSSCEKLDDIVLPSTLKTLGKGAFSYCKSLKTFTFTKSLVTEIPQVCFQQTPLTNGLTIPDNITSVGSYAFLGCKYDELIIDSATIRDLNDIDSYLFTSPTKVYIKGSTGPAAGSSIANNFDSATTDKPGYLKYAAKPFMYELIEETNIYKVSRGNPTGDITIPSSYNAIPVEIIGNFYQANITSVVIPSSIKTIEDSGFTSCTKLSSVTFDGTSQIEKIDGAFNGCSKLSSFVIPEKVKEITSFSFGTCYDAEADTGLASVTFPSSIEKIGYGSFNEDKKLTADGLTFNTTGATYKIYKATDFWGSGEEVETASFDPTTNKNQALIYLLGNFTDPSNPVYYRWEKNS